MKGLIVGLALFCIAGVALAAQIEVDAPPGATQCGFYLDGATTATVVTVVNGKCRMLLSSTLAAGPHQARGDSRQADPVWGTLPPGAKSDPYDFTKPGASGLPAPTNWKLVP